MGGGLRLELKLDGLIPFVLGKIRALLILIMITDKPFFVIVNDTKSKLGKGLRFQGGVGYQNGKLTYRLHIIISVIYLFLI